MQIRVCACARTHTHTQSLVFLVSYTRLVSLASCKTSALGLYLSFSHTVFMLDTQYILVG